MNVKLSFTVGEGKNFGFLGPHGAGKTTISCILTGRVMVAQIPVNDLAFAKVNTMHSAVQVLNSVSTFCEGCRKQQEPGSLLCDCIAYPRVRTGKVPAR